MLASGRRAHTKRNYAAPAERQSDAPRWDKIYVAQFVLGNSFAVLYLLVLVSYSIKFPFL